MFTKGNSLTISLRLISSPPHMIDVNWIQLSDTTPPLMGVLIQSGPPGVVRTPDQCGRRHQNNLELKAPRKLSDIRKSSSRPRPTLADSASLNWPNQPTSSKIVWVTGLYLLGSCTMSFYTQVILSVCMCIVCVCEKYTKKQAGL